MRAFFNPSDQGHRSSFTKELLACQYRLSEVVEMLTAAEANIRKCAQVVFVKFYDQFLIPSSSFGDSLKLCRRLTHYAFRTFHNKYTSLIHSLAKNIGSLRVWAISHDT